MPTINITDTTGVIIDTVTTATNPVSSALQKYGKSPFINLVLLPDAVRSLHQPLSAAQTTSLTFGFHYANHVDFGASLNPELTFAGGLMQTITINAVPGSPVLPLSLFEPPITVQSGEAWLSLAHNGSVNVGLSAAAGDLTFGIGAGGGIAIEYFRRFSGNPGPTVEEAFREVLSGMILPGDVQDLEAMKTGDISTVSGSGSLTFSGSASLSVAANPLASPSLPLVNKSVSLDAGASIDVGASFKIEGAYEIRVRKLADHVVELGYYRKKGTQWSVSVQAQAGIDASFGDDAFLPQLLGALTGNPSADLVNTIKLELSAEQIQALQDAIADGVDHSLRASLELQLSSANTDEAAFSYRIDTAALDAASAAAVHEALGGRLSKLTALEKNDDGSGVIGAGVVMLRSVLKSVRDNKASLKVNLLGLLNFTSVFELIRKGEVVFEPLTGELTINELVSGTSISALTLPAAQERLRKIRFNSLLVTTAYRASRAIASMDVTSSDVFFAFNQNTNAQTFGSYLDALQGAGLITDVKRSQIQATFQGSGKSQFLLRVEFSDSACEAMFLDNGGNPRLRAEFVAIGRSALAALLAPADTADDPNQFRRAILADNLLWKQLEAAGQANFGTILSRLDPARLSVVRSDYSEIEWWAESMASTAQRLVSLRAFIGSADPAALEGDNTFRNLRDQLQRHVAGVVANSQLQFGLPFGLVALTMAAAPFGMPTGAIVFNGVTQEFNPAVVAGR